MAECEETGTVVWGETGQMEQKPLSDALLFCILKSPFASGAFLLLEN